MIPPRRSLVHHTAAVLREGIAAGRWRDWLPGERDLAADLLVGRNTLRAALRELTSDGLLETVPGSGHRILRATAPAAHRPPPRSIGLLVPDGLHALRLGQALWIDQLRALLIKQGFELQFHHPRRFPRDPHRHTCWVLVLCAATLQRRFAREAIPCVIAGSAHAGVSLPSVDHDHRAVCRHAAGLLIARGHRRLVFLTRPPVFAGDRESELGFIEGARLSRRPGVSAEVVRHDDTRDGVTRVLRRLLRSSHPPDALLVGDPRHCLTVSSLLASASRSGIALVCRDDDPALAHLVPAPARYTVPPASIARHLLKLILRAPAASEPAAIRLQPRLIPGETLRTPVP